MQLVEDTLTPLENDHENDENKENDENVITPKAVQHNSGFNLVKSFKANKKLLVPEPLKILEGNPIVVPVVFH